MIRTWAAPEDLSKAIDPALIKRTLAEAKVQAERSIEAMDLPSLKAKIDYYEREAAQVRSVRNGGVASSCSSPFS